MENVFTGSTKNPVNPPVMSEKTKFNSTAEDAWGWAQFITARSTLMCQDGGDLSTDPFVTNFNLGNGFFFNIKGERHADTEWYNIGVQDYLPSWRWWFTNTFMGREVRDEFGRIVVGANDVESTDLKLDSCVKIKVNSEYKYEYDVEIKCSK